MYEYNSKFEEDLIKSQRRLDDGMNDAYEQRAEVISLLKKLLFLGTTVAIGLFAILVAAY